MDNVLRELPYAADAPFNARKWQHDPTCLPDTRVDLLQQIHNWIDRNDKRSIFWLNGLAGTGKSTIARTVAYNCFQQGCLGASFFFSKGGGDIGHASQFYTTIARQLAEESQFLKRCIYDAIKENKTIATQSYANQWRQLILGPLSKLDRGYRPFSFVIVIDALDECESNADIMLILQLFVEAQLLEKVSLRVFLTSRPDTPIRYGFDKITDKKHNSVILHHISPSIVDHDISIFLKYNLAIIRQERSLEAEWPGDEVIRRLVRIAGGLFIWASTACRFIHEGKRFVAQRLHTILQGSNSASTAPEKHLDNIYTTVLKQSVASGYSDHERQELFSMLRQILGSIVILFSPLSTCSLSRLLYTPITEINQTLDDLHSVIDIPLQKMQPLRLHHPSFRDFLLNKDRCVNLNLWVDEKLAHQKLMEHCIQLMSTSLKKDICNAIIPGTFTSEIDRSKVDQALPPELQYACLYWTQHLQKSGAYLQDNEHVHQFLQNHFLNWFEALGWMQKTSEGITQIISLEATAAVSSIIYLKSFY